MPITATLSQTTVKPGDTTILSWSGTPDNPCSPNPPPPASPFSPCSTGRVSITGGPLVPQNPWSDPTLVIVPANGASGGADLKSGSVTLAIQPFANPGTYTLTIDFTAQGAFLFPPCNCNLINGTRITLTLTVVGQPIAPVPTSPPPPPQPKTTTVIFAAQVTQTAATSTETDYILKGTLTRADGGSVSGFKLAFLLDEGPVLAWVTLDASGSFQSPLLAITTSGPHTLEVSFPGTTDPNGVIVAAASQRYPITVTAVVAPTPPPPPSGSGSAVNPPIVTTTPAGGITSVPPTMPNVPTPHVLTPLQWVILLGALGVGVYVVMEKG